MLAQAGIVPAHVVPAAIDESVRKGELPRAHALRLAAEKARAAAARHSAPAFILAADTVVACGRRILPKAENDDEVRACLTLAVGPAPSGDDGGGAAHAGRATAHPAGADARLLPPSR